MTQPRLLIDDSAGFNQGAGIGRYSRSLLRAALPALASEFDLRIWYASDTRHGARFEAEALDAIPESLRKRVKRSRWSRRRIDQIARLPLDIPTRVLTGRADLAYSPDFTLPGTFGGAGMITVHDVAFELIPDAYPPGLLSYLRTVVPRNVRRADLVAVVSRTTRIDVVERYNVHSDRVVVIPNAADDRFFGAHSLPEDRRRELGLPDDYLLTVGTIEPRKNYRTLLAAQQRAFKETGRPLVVVGRAGWGNRDEMKTLNELADAGAVVPLLDAADEDLPGLYCGARAVVYVPLYEGFGLPVLEAMASGATVITSDIPSVREVASGHATIVPPLDVDQMAEAISAPAAITGEQRAAQMAAARNYSWETSGTILREALDSLAERVHA
jgi:glycosyltransferase involved in cell wall biosynthesis